MKDEWLTSNGWISVSQGPRVCGFSKGNFHRSVDRTGPKLNRYYTATWCLNTSQRWNNSKKNMFLKSMQMWDILIKLCWAEVQKYLSLAAKSEIKKKELQNKARKSVFGNESQASLNICEIPLCFMGGEMGLHQKLPTKAGTWIVIEEALGQPEGGLAAFSHLPTAFQLWLTAPHCHCQAGTRQRAERGPAAGLACRLLTHTLHNPRIHLQLMLLLELASPAVWRILMITYRVITENILLQVVLRFLSYINVFRQ